MKQNMGKADRTIRLIIATALMILFFANQLPGILGYISLGVAIIFTLTSFIGFCPLYKPFGFSTCNVKEKDK